jgi:hypothetical protein
MAEITRCAANSMATPHNYGIIINLKERQADLTSRDHNEILQKLINLAKEGKLCRGSLSALAAKYSFCTKTIQHLWREVQHNNFDIKRIDINFKF